jgi:uncharacterized protein (DUF302 family)
VVDFWHSTGEVIAHVVKSFDLEGFLVFEYIEHGKATVNICSMPCGYC